jgi:hypothetical protein
MATSVELNRADSTLNECRGREVEAIDRMCFHMVNKNHERGT